LVSRPGERATGSGPTRHHSPQATATSSHSNWAGACQGAVMTGAVLAVLASLCYGSSDIVAGVAARRVTPIAVALWGHGIGTAVVVAATVVVAGRPTWGAFGPGVLAGGVAGLGLLLYYGALRRGQVSVVTPLAGHWRRRTGARGRRHR
jgi:drug/metabolite transporter (DMT)-like permease